MTRTIATLLIAGSLTGVTVTQADDMIALLAPQAAHTTQQISLRNIYTKAQADSWMNNTPLDVELAEEAKLHTEEGVVYTVNGHTVTAVTDWSCDLLVVTSDHIEIGAC